MCPPPPPLFLTHTTQRTRRCFSLSPHIQPSPFLPSGEDINLDVSVLAATGRQLSSNNGANPFASVGEGGGGGGGGGGGQGGGGSANNEVRGMSRDWPPAGAAFGDPNTKTPLLGSQQHGRDFSEEFPHGGGNPFQHAPLTKRTDGAEDTCCSACSVQ